MKTWMGLLLLAWAGVVLAGGVYKWVDANGEVHFGERPPADVQSQAMPMQIAPIPSSSDDDAERDQRRQKLLNAFDHDQVQQQAQAQKEKQQEAVRARNCTIARDRLQGLTDSNMIYSLDANGKRHYYDDSQRNSAIQNARNGVDRWCD